MPLLLALLLSLSPQESVAWTTDYAVARIEARNQGRLILLHFPLDDRPASRAMDEETFAKAPAIQSLHDRFIAVRVDIETQSKLFEATVGGRVGLATCVVDADGDVISARNGYAAPEDFLRFLEKALAGYARIKAARESLAASPHAPGRLLTLGEAYRDCDSLRRAEDCYLRAIDGATQRNDAASLRSAAVSHERMARLRVVRGKNLEARKHLEEARRLDPEGRSAEKDRLQLTGGLILAVERRHAEAATVLREAIRLYPGSDERDHMTYALGFVLHQDSQDKPALEALETVVRVYPRSFWVAAAREQIEHIKNPQPDHAH